MIVLDTHIWVWWVHDIERLSIQQREALNSAQNESIGVSAISCWEIAKLVERGRLELPVTLEKWFEQALTYPGIRILPLTPEIAIASTRLPEMFSRDPADQIILATARIYNCPLLTSDRKILAYPHAATIA
jgi:PIN domain nuclease of toxin-antitoxin system